MKTFTFKSIAMVAIVSLLLGCEDDPKTIRIPFEAIFFTNRITLEERPECGVAPMLYNVQEGSGNAKRVGDFTTHITFCFNRETLKYINGQGYFKTENGDELYFTIEGQIKPSQDPAFVLEFQDPFIFTGGTGRFKGATGKGVTNSFVNHDRVRTDHVWTGTLILRK